MPTYPYQPVDQAQNIASKVRLMEIMQGLVMAPLKDLEDVVRDGYAPEARVHVTHPVNNVPGQQAVRERVWQPLRQAVPDVERRDDILAGGLYRGAPWVGCVGHYIGTFEQEWLGIPATRNIVAIRFAEGHALRDGKIVESYLFIDFLDLMRQAGYWPLAPSLGQEMRWLPPRTQDGVILTVQDNAVSRRSIERVLSMHAALGQYLGPLPTRAALDAMEQVKHWHPNFMWYGAAGIGTTRGLAGFENGHQIPFVLAFPDRGGSEIGHFIRIGDGQYAVTGGWGYLQGTHVGPGFLGMPPTGRRIRMRVMDFYRCDDQTIAENWVPFDIPHLLLQMGVDVFGRMGQQLGKAPSVGPDGRHWLISPPTLTD